MTTFAAIFGALPIALGAGAGSELRQPLGVAVVGGLLVSQVLTLYITPVVYLYLDRVDCLLKYRLDPQRTSTMSTNRRYRTSSLRSEEGASMADAPMQGARKATKNLAQTVPGKEPPRGDLVRVTIL
jgi:hypothetical protein